MVVFKCKDLPVCCSADIPHYKIYLKILKERDNIQFLTPVSRVPSEAKKETQQVHTGKFYLTWIPGYHNYSKWWFATASFYLTMGH